MNKKTLGILIPYYKNSEQCETAFKRLMEELVKQLNDDMILYVYEDGQVSDWLNEYKEISNVKIVQNSTNEGVAYARNCGINYLINKVLYILFIDSDDIVENNYLKVMCEYCADNTHEIVESTFYVNDKIAGFNPNAVRSGAAGSALQTKIIGNVRFDEKLQIGEDTKFMNECIDLSKYRKRKAPTIYIYQYGINPNSLTKLYGKKEIGKERGK